MTSYNRVQETLGQILTTASLLKSFFFCVRHAIGFPMRHDYIDVISRKKAIRVRSFNFAKSHEPCHIKKMLCHLFLCESLCKNDT